MSIDSAADFKTGLVNQPYQINFVKDAITFVSRFPYSSWRLFGSPSQGGIPTTSVAMTSATLGAAPFPGGTPSGLRLYQADWSIGHTGGGLLLVDFLNQQGGLSGTSVSTQTTNLPTAALTRFTSGDGVLAAIEIYTAVGSTASFFTCSYTNQAGTSGRTSKATRIGTSNYNAASRFLIMSLADGDTGVRSVESLTLSGTTGTAGNFGITLFKPLAILTSDFGEGRMASNNMLLSGGLQLEEIPPNACLGLIMMVPQTSFLCMNLNLKLAEDL